MILFIDEETDFVSPYKEGLEDEGWAVTLVDDIDEAFRLYCDRVSEIELLIVDVMIPGDSKVLADRDTDGGKRAGEQLLLKILEWESNTDVARTVPKIILTNVKTQDFHDKWIHKPEICKCLRKPNTTVRELVTAVRECTGDFDA